MIRRIDRPTEFRTPIPNDPDGRVEADAIRVGGDWTPGRCKIRKAGIPILWDKRKGYGYAGATIIYTGDDLAEFDVEFTFWRQDQIDAWKVWAKKYLTKSPAKPQFAGSFLPSVPRPKALGVYNPLLAELGITTIALKRNNQYDHDALLNGKYVKVVEFIQARFPKPFLGSPKQPIPDNKAKSPSVQDAQDLEIAKLTKRVMGHGKQLNDLLTGQ